LANNQEFDKGLRVLRSLKIALLGVTKYDDVLAKADPEMAKLIEARRQAEKNYKEVVNDRNQGQMALETALAVFEKCDQEVKDRQAILNKRGIIPKQLGSEYKGEEKGEGWQAPEMRMTKYYSQEERKNSQLQVDEQGLVLDSEKRPMDGTLGYVMDVEGKKLHQFAKNNSTGLMEVTETGPRHVMVHHSTPLSGEEVVGAGYITFENGKIVSISNNSGHYKPGAVQLIQTVEELLKQGAFLDTTLAITEESRPLTDNARELYDKTVKAQKALENLVTEGFKRLETIHCLVQEVEEAKRNYNDLVGNGESQETLDTVWTKYLEIQRTLCEAVDRQLKDNEQLKQKAEAVMKAQKVLDKLGIGPKNKMTGKVEHYFGITDDMKGMQIRMDAPGNQVGVMEFLSSGGNSKGKPIIPEPHQDNDDYKLKVEETLDKEHERVDIKKEMHKQLLKDIVDIQKKMKITTRDDLETDAKERADVINVYLNELEHTGLPALKEVRECLKKSVDPDALKLYDHVDKRIRAFEEWLRKAPSEEELAEAIKALRGVPKTAPETVVRDIQEWVHVYDKSVGAYVRVKKDLGQGREDVGEMSEQDNSGETSEEG
jgi:exonuclease VII small subunit